MATVKKVVKKMPPKKAPPGKKVAAKKPMPKGKPVAKLAPKGKTPTKKRAAPKESIYRTLRKWTYPKLEALTVKEEWPRIRTAIRSNGVGELKASELVAYLKKLEGEMIDWEAKRVGTGRPPGRPRKEESAKTKAAPKKVASPKEALAVAKAGAAKLMAKAPKAAVPVKVLPKLPPRLPVPAAVAAAAPVVKKFLLLPNAAMLNGQRG